MYLAKVIKTFFLLSVCIGVCGMFLMVFSFVTLDINNKNISLASIAGMRGDTKPARNWNIGEKNIPAKSAIALEFTTQGQDKILLNQSSKVQLPIASLTKLMTAIVVLDNYDMKAVTKISKIADSQPSVVQDVKLDDQVSVETLLDIMLVASSNKSAYALSEIMGKPLFVEYMNAKARHVGMERTFFEDPTGLSDNNQSSAEDLAKLAKYILENYPTISKTTRLSSLEIQDSGVFENTNDLLNQIPETLLGKTGFTSNAKGCLILAVKNEQNNDYIIYVILGADDRFLAMKELMGWVNAAYTW